MSWARALLVGTVIVAIAYLVLVVVPDALVTQASGLARGGRVALATAQFTVSLVAMLWALRRLQARWLRR